MPNDNRPQKVAGNPEDEPEIVAKYGAFIEALSYGIGLAFVGFGAFLSLVLLERSL